MIHKYGNVFDTEANFIGHGVNCMGVMGAGIAKSIKAIYPEAFEDYKSALESRKLSCGHFRVSFIRGDRYIVHFATQREPGPHASHWAIRTSLERFAESFGESSEKITIAVPEIGCGIGGLKWRDVRDIMLDVEEDFPFLEFEVWHYTH